MVPLNSNITKATPKLAPASIPRILGPAKGLRNSVCNIRPHVLSDIPQSKAVSIWGTRLSRMIYDHCGCSATCPPSRIRTTSATGILSDPHNRLATAKSSMATIKSTMITLCLIPRDKNKLFSLEYQVPDAKSE